MLIEALTLWMARTNAWMVAPSGEGGECVLIDAPPEPAAILSALAHKDLRLVALLTTHGHVDHIGGVTEVVKAQPRVVPVAIHDGDRHLLLDPVGTGDVLGALLEAEGLDHRPPEVIHSLDDGQHVSGAGLRFTAIHTPGHTKGSTCFLLEAENSPPTLFSGDHLFAGSIGRTDLPGGSFEELMASMATKILPLDDATVVLPGHGPGTTIGHERRTNPFLAPGRSTPGGR